MIKNGSLAVHLIGKGLAQAKGLDSKHSIKQVDRLLSNDGINLEVLFPIWLKHIIGSNDNIVVSMDWTDFDCDNHSTLLMSLQTSHGRNMPLIWKTFDKAHLKGNMHTYEESLLADFKKYIDDSIHVTVVADRGFSSIVRFDEISKLDFDYIIRTKSDIYIDIEKNGEQKLIKEYLPEKSGNKKFNDIYFTKNKYELPVLVISKQKDMKAPWIIATSRHDLKTREILHFYSKRWGIETLFRDIKDYQFGMGLSKTHSKNTQRRDRLLFISALAIAGVKQ